MLLHGVFPPITTPFYPDGNVYYKKLESNVDRYSRTPVSGIVVLGSTGEAIMLSDQERRDVLKDEAIVGEIEMLRPEIAARRVGQRLHRQEQDPGKRQQDGEIE